MIDIISQWKTMSIAEAISGRRSIRMFKSKAVDRGTIKRVVHASLLAPSAHNSQPVRFAVVESSTRKRLLAEMQEVWKQDLARDGFLEDAIQRRIASSNQMIHDAPVLILVSYTMADMHKYPDSKRVKAEETMAVQSVGAAIQNLLLGAHAEGLGSCWGCAPLFAKAVVREVLKMKSELEPQAFILLGYPDEAPEMPERREVEDILRFV